MHVTYAQFIQWMHIRRVNNWSSNIKGWPYKLQLINDLFTY